MRFMVIIKANKDSEAGIPPDDKLFPEMLKFNEELANAGIMQAAEGLHPSSKGVRVNFSGGRSTVTDGPFIETKELIAGFWIWELPSLSDAIEWVRRIPGTKDEEVEIEIRQVIDQKEFGDAFTPELQEQEERIRKQMAAKK